MVNELNLLNITTKICCAKNSKSIVKYNLLFMVWFANIGAMNPGL